MQNWIKCSERLPPKDGCVIGCGATLSVGEFYFTAEDETFSYSTYCGEYHFTTEDVSHWQPLPEPPQE